MVVAADIGAGMDERCWALEVSDGCLALCHRLKNFYRVEGSFCQCDLIAEGLLGLLEPLALPGGLFGV